jgi:hypothetical protein
MGTAATHEGRYTTTGSTLYMAMELSEAKWLLMFTVGAGQKPHGILGCSQRTTYNDTGGRRPLCPWAGFARADIEMGRLLPAASLIAHGRIQVQVYGLSWPARIEGGRRSSGSHDL